MGYWLTAFDNLLIPTSLGASGSHTITLAERASPLVTLPGGVWDPFGANIPPRRASTLQVRCLIASATLGEGQATLDSWQAKVGVRGTLIRSGDDGSLQYITARLREAEVSRRAQDQLVVPLSLTFDALSPAWSGPEILNLLSNPSLEVDAAGWTGSGVGAAPTRSNEWADVGAWSLKCSDTTLNHGAKRVLLSECAPNVTYALRLRVKRTEATTNIRLYFGDRVSGAYAYTTADAALTTDVQTMTVTRTIRGGADDVYMMLRCNTAGGSTWYIDAAQLELGGVAHAYADGDQAGCLWVGTAHASQTRRGVSATLNASPKNVTVTNNGNVACLNPVISVTAQGSSITALTIAVSGVSEITWTGTLAASKTLVIDCNALTVKNDGANAYSGFTCTSNHKIDSWIRLEPGANTVAVSRTGGDNTSAVSFAFRDKYG